MISPRLRKTLKRVPTLASFSSYYEKSLGHRIRDFISAVGATFHPIKKYLFPNFIAVHYFYIITLTIIGSILLYPVKGHKYIDVLFLAAGSATQGGLNTVDVNSLTLYQQMVLYISCVLCTPIAIHSFLAFVRLYWFERHFDGIRVSSRRDFKMRRTRTIIGREMTARTISRARFNTSELHSRPSYRASRNNDNFKEKLFSGEMVNRDEQSSRHSSNLDVTSTTYQNGSNKSWSSSNTANDDEDYVGMSGRNGPNSYKDSSNYIISRAEKFAGRRGSTEITPADMYRSITMLQDQHKENEYNEGPALVISAPSFARDNSSLEQPEIIVRYEQHKGKQSLDSGSNIGDRGKYAIRKEEDSSDSNSGLNESASTDPDESRDDRSISNTSANEVGMPISLNLPISGAMKDLLSTPKKESGSDNVIDLESDRSDLFKRSSIPRNESMSENPNRIGPSIQFDLKEPPSKRRLTNTHTESSQQLWGINNRRNSKYLLKHIPRGKKLRRRIRKSLYLSTHEISNCTTSPTSNERVSSENGDNVEEYFADDETDDEGNPKDVSLVDDIKHDLKKTTSQVEPDTNLDSMKFLKGTKTFDTVNRKHLTDLTQSPDFQKLVYKKWKEKHKKTKKGIPWNGNFFENERTNEIFHKHHMEQLSNEQSYSHVSENSQYQDHLADHPGFEDTDAQSLNSIRNSDINYEDAELGTYNLHFDPDYSLADPRYELSRTMSTNYLSWQPAIGRNSTFVGLSKLQKDELGGVEYRSIKLLCWILLVYYIGFHIMAFLFLVPWVLGREQYKLLIKEDGISLTWWGFFTAMSAFNNLGLTLTPDSMVSFNGSIFSLTVMIWFIIIGNTGFPVLLRFIIWIMFKLAPDLSQRKESLGFLLDHPRRCFTLLFPSAATWWLLITLVALNATDLILFIIFDFGSEVVAHLTKGRRVLVGLFQGVSTRTAGFSVVDLSKLHPSIQVSYMLMMYVSVLPLAISIRRTNVYEEQSLGIYAQPDQIDTESDEDDGDDEKTDDSYAEREKRHIKKESKKKREVESSPKESTRSFIGAHVRRQLSFDLWFLFLGLFIICICEGSKIKDNSKPEFNVFSILFEIVSAYGTVGLSLGFPDTNQSFSRQFTTLSKLVIIALLIRGRNRGLPYTVDRAIILPSNRLDNIDHIQELKMNRMNSEEANEVNDVDPVTVYFKKKINKLMKGLRKVKDGVEKIEEPFIHSYEMRDFAKKNRGSGRDNHEYYNSDEETNYPDSKHGNDMQEIQKKSLELEYNENKYIYSTPSIESISYGDVDSRMYQMNRHKHSV